MTYRSKSDSDSLDRPALTKEEQNVLLGQALFDALEARSMGASVTDRPAGSDYKTSLIDGEFDLVSVAHAFLRLVSALPRR